VYIFSLKMMAVHEMLPYFSFYARKKESRPCENDLLNVSTAAPV